MVFENFFLLKYSYDFLTLTSSISSFPNILIVFRQHHPQFILSLSHKLKLTGTTLITEEMKNSQLKITFFFLPFAIPNFLHSTHNTIPVTSNHISCTTSALFAFHQHKIVPFLTKFHLSNRKKIVFERRITFRHARSL